MLKLGRAGFAVMLAVLTLLSAPVSVANAQYPPTTPPGFIVAPNSGPPGYPVTVTVTNCVANEEVVFTLNGQQYSATCNPVTLQATVTIPAPSTTGPYEVCASFLGPPSLTQGFRSAVQAGAPAQTTPGLTICDSIDVIAQSASTTTTTTTPAGGPTTTISGAIPTTGSGGLGTTSSIAIVLLVVGIGMFAVARVRRRRPTSTT